MDFDEHSIFDEREGKEIWGQNTNSSFDKDCCKRI